jgi:hypothetical protein
VNDIDTSKVRETMSKAADILAAGLDETKWDYLLVAVPQGQARGQTTVSMLSNVPASVLPDFVRYIHHAYDQCRAAGRVIDDEPGEGCAS